MLRVVQSIDSANSGLSFTPSSFESNWLLFVSKSVKTTIPSSSYLTFKARSSRETIGDELLKFLRSGVYGLLFEDGVASVAWKAKDKGFRTDRMSKTNAANITILGSNISLRSPSLLVLSVQDFHGLGVNA